MDLIEREINRLGRCADEATNTIDRDDYLHMVRTLEGLEYQEINNGICYYIVCCLNELEALEAIEGVQYFRISVFGNLKPVKYKRAATMLINNKIIVVGAEVQND